MKTLLPDTTFVGADECRVALSLLLGEGLLEETQQLALFESPTRERGVSEKEEPFLSAMRRRGGPSWARTVLALDRAVASLRAKGLSHEDLERAATRGPSVVGSRARTLARAMKLLDERLALAGVRDERSIGWALAGAIEATNGRNLVSLLGTRYLRARWVLSWEPEDLAWWRALDEKLGPLSGGARIVLPALDRPLDGEKQTDVFDVIAENVSRALDAAPESEFVSVSFGVGGEPTISSARVSIVQAQDASAQATAVANVVSEAIDGGAEIERIVIALPALAEHTLEPLRRAFDEIDLPLFDPRGTPPSKTPVVSASLVALSAARTLDRKDVATLLRSGYVDVERLVPDGDLDNSRSSRILPRLADILETTRTSEGTDPAERLVRTFSDGIVAVRHLDESERDLLERVARDLVAALVDARAAKTRVESVNAARVLFGRLGLDALAGRGARRTFSEDAIPAGVPRVERLAVARDARAWHALEALLESHASVAARLNVDGGRVDLEALRVELVDSLDASLSRPSSARVGAVRVCRVADLGGEALDLLVVVDTNEGVLPSDRHQEALLSESLDERLLRVTRGKQTSLREDDRSARELAALALGASESERVVFAYPNEDASGAPLGPSPIIDGARYLGATVVEARRERLGGLTTSATLRAERERIREGFFLDPARPRSEIVAQLVPTAEVAELLTSETGGRDRHLAVTGLERFAKCPFAGLAHVVFAAREEEKRSEFPDAREEGSLVHEILAAAFEETRQLWAQRPRDRDRILERSLACVERTLRKWQGHAPLRSLVSMRAREVARAIVESALDDEAWNFDRAEQAFGGYAPESWPGYRLREDGAALSLRGTVDRIDVRSDGTEVRVIDYKRSRHTVRAAARALGDTVLQVPLYACVAAAELKRPATGTYLAFQSRDDAADAKLNETFLSATRDLARRDSSGLAPVERRALSIVARLRRGELVPIPASESECRTCSASGGCRKPRFAMLADEEAEPV